MRTNILILTTIIYLTITLAYSQGNQLEVCAGKLLDEVDSVTGNYTRRFKDKMVVKNTDTDLLELDLKQFNDVLVISVLVTGAGDCLDESSKMTVTFTTGTTITLAQEGKFNCDREYAVFFGGTFGKKKDFRMLLANEIKTLRVETRKSVIDKTRKNFVEVTFNADQQKEFIQRLECLIGE